MADTTNINDLPPMQGNNITLEMKEQRSPSMVTAAPPGVSAGGNIAPQMSQNRPAPHQLPNGDINAIVNGIQSAADSNLTSLTFT